jgi:mevalonate kinase
MQFRSNGKLLITGEYLILDGALGLSLPTRFGQSMNVSKESRASIKWTSFDSKNSPWFSAEYDNDIKTIIDCTDVGIAEELKHLFHAAKELSPLFNPAGCKVQCKLDFPRNWGLGSSSTLRINMSKWANISPFELHMATSNGSGYDIAAGMSNEPILFSNQTEFNSTPVSFSPKFIKHLFFIHLNKKQKSTDEVVSYHKLKTDLKLDYAITAMDELTMKFCNAPDLVTFENCMLEHEIFMSAILQRPMVQEELFNDYQLGNIKSLGAWGGDFVLATGPSKKSVSDYFSSKEYFTVLHYNDLIV